MSHIKVAQISDILVSLNHRGIGNVRMIVNFQQAESTLHGQRDCAVQIPLKSQRSLSVADNIHTEGGGAGINP